MEKQAIDEDGQKIKQDYIFAKLPHYILSGSVHEGSKIYFLHSLYDQVLGKSIG